MSPEEYPSISLHNVAETTPAEWAADGERLYRVPAAVIEGLNQRASDRVRHPTGCEIRFVPDSPEAEIEVTLSAPEPTRVHTFWGPFQPWQPTDIGPEPTTLTLSLPERLRDLAKNEATGRFAPQVCRLRLERVPAVALHEVRGDCRPPDADELPDRRYLAYGTSITEGAVTSAPHLNYVTHVARTCGYDALNLGCSGSAYAESAMADYIASREDWDVATLALSVNMANGGFSPAEFRERADVFVNTVAAAHPDNPVVCVTLFPYFADLTETGDAEHARAYREALRSVVADAPHANLSLVEGPELLEVSGLTADLLHPGDAGMAAIGAGLARHLERVVE
ncbi:GDSL-type esterase/lipase family protein [Natronobiforma cellulositropha]|uniref:GDSL-type esterase/lipase family protein n=1 Tax=Natronobiforma cellulositropha TaxID=1679076 RepID=UPI0021D5ED1F|nr:GDSL-type esterase/lipase family protein [Natronobiforma cellulositropha]